MAHHAVKALIEGRAGRVVVMQKGEIVDLDIEEGLAQTKDLDQALFEAQQMVAT